MPGILEGFDLEQPSENAISAIFESTLFDSNSQECNSSGQVITAKLLPEHFRFCLLGNNSNESVKRVLAHFPVLTFAGQRVEFRTAKPDVDSRMIYTDELPVFNFICSHLRDAISTVNIPVDSNSTPKELHFIKQLSVFDCMQLFLVTKINQKYFLALSEIAFFQRSSVDFALDDEVDLLIIH
uniref:Uncharacterized protein n=1 Tax=Panagrolaimus davidi TaxID=227884 RepID=A0A914PXX1_9BILA